VEGQNETEFDPVAGGKGWRDSGNKFYSLDASYVLSDKWRLTGYASYGDQTIRINHSTGYMADLNNRSTAVGLQVAGQATGQLQVGVNLTYINDINKYGIAANTGTAGDRLTGLTVTHRALRTSRRRPSGSTTSPIANRVGVYGQYMINRSSDIRLDVVYQKTKYDDWVWGRSPAPFVYADNTIVKQKVDQNVTMVAVTYIFRFR
jgi:hypothetical protein